MSNAKKSFNKREWYSAVYLAMSMLELKPRRDFSITGEDLKHAAHDLLKGLIQRSEGETPTLTDKTRGILKLIEAESLLHSKNGGGLQ